MVDGEHLVYGKQLTKCTVESALKSICDFKQNFQDKIGSILLSVKSIFSKCEITFYKIQF